MGGRGDEEESTEVERDDSKKSSEWDEFRGFGEAGKVCLDYLIG